MSDLSIQHPKWGTEEMLPLPKRFNTAMRELARRRREESDLPWSELVLSPDFFTREDAEAIEREALESGYRFEFSAVASLESEPEKYRRPEKALTMDADEEEGAVSDGRRKIGAGDNVIRKAEPLRGTVRLVSTIEQVMNLLTDGVPEHTIAVIDDSGGTLTAPVMEDFAGVICLGGTVRSHLGILAREYDVPTLMNCHIGPLQDGDVVELEVTAAPPAADAYETGDTGHARIWKIEGDR